METRAVAAEMNDPEARRIMLAIAEAYERLARYAESESPLKSEAGHSFHRPKVAARYPYRKYPTTFS